eukprot:CAMPEP_0181193754 /NCGR_PEP_ID=MMETSP1096-20121128/13983_1 /TAXON_ID=156174 ORGANISM="Chrysochromulina ericina, Strain CCMP281" /NCGR_SAMPLE_ID=MMETSP1096 /ASSEMBLY_ACC=CAM_ASM_000453 /LENGTH=279 /DNA_ID=CAMNT_0023283233 /DNA_START=105 /DNA_END=944 /DNA_ORIENTATION=-
MAQTLDEETLIACASSILLTHASSYPSCYPLAPLEADIPPYDANVTPYEMRRGTPGPVPRTGSPYVRRASGAPRVLCDTDASPCSTLLVPAKRALRTSETASCSFVKQRAELRASDDINEECVEGPGRVTSKAVYAQKRPIARSNTAGVFSSLTPAGTVDPALIFSMERTFLSAFNQAFYLMFLGSGLMAINDFDDGAVAVGAVIICSGILFCLYTYYMHVSRLKLLTNRVRVSNRSSNTWLGILTGLMVCTAIIELVYMFIYPLLDRAKSVELVGVQS